MRTTRNGHRWWPSRPDRPDVGSSVIAVLLVVATLAVLTAIASLMVAGMSAGAADTGCATGPHELLAAHGTVTPEDSRC
jgi:hypothetical protein